MAAWSAYKEALKTNPVLAKMCVEGKPLFQFDRTRMFKSGLVGFMLHGSLSHYYYQFCEFLIPFDVGGWFRPKLHSIRRYWAVIWNIIYFTILALLRFESPVNIYTELKATFLPMLTMEVMAYEPDPTVNDQDF